MSRRHETKLFEGERDLNDAWSLAHVLDIKHIRPEIINQVRCPIVVDIHDYYWTQFYSFVCPDLPLRLALQKYRRQQYRKILSRAHAVIVHSDYVKQQIDHRNVFVVRYAIDPMDARGNAQAREDLILFVGRDYFRKGIYVLIRALPHVLKKRPNARLVVIGREYVHSKIASKLLSRRLPIEYINGLPREQVLDYYRRAKVFVLPSQIEAFGIVSLEAMALGVPVVAARVGGIPELIVHEKNGLLFERHDAQALADHIVTCLSDPDRAQKFALEGAKTLSKTYRVERMIDDLECVYQSLLNQR
jgi:glycosyltransferase involved in cell wall biosynthesis